MRLAESYMRQAGARLKDAGDAHSDSNYPYAVRLGQECVELCLKAVLRAVGIDYPKVHDVSDVLVDVGTRFPSWFQVELDFLSESSRVLVRKREISLYGGEEAFLSPEDVIGRDDAGDALNRARRVFRDCERLLKELRDATFESDKAT